jgi:hypothetical protein
MPLPLAQRLGEFFWEIVLGRHAFTGGDLSRRDRQCRAARLRRPNCFKRCAPAAMRVPPSPSTSGLCFALLGAALPAGKAAQAAAAVDRDRRCKLELPDFRFEESRVLAPGLGMPAGDAERALYRIIYWTSGSPLPDAKAVPGGGAQCRAHRFGRGGGQAGGGPFPGAQRGQQRNRA